MKFIILSAVLMFSFAAKAQWNDISDDKEYRNSLVSSFENRQGGWHCSGKIQHANRGYRMMFPWEIDQQRITWLMFNSGTFLASQNMAMAPQLMFQWRVDKSEKAFTTDVMYVALDQGRIRYIKVTEDNTIEKKVHGETIRFNNYDYTIYCE
jgi:hypothetical protein